jgi:diaminopimelate decarboxylase
MRSDLPPAVQQLVEQLAPEDGPQLIFERTQLERTMREVADAARAAELRVLFAVKSFPHAEVLAMAARWLDGFDVASGGELEAVRPLLDARHSLSITDPTGRAVAAHGGHVPALDEESTSRDASAPSLVAQAPIVSCESMEQLEEALRSAPHAPLAVRLSSSLLGRDRAVGSIQSGDGHHRSRFGVDVDPARARGLLAQMAARAAEHQRPLGLHLHHSGVVPTSAARFLDSARAALELAAAADFRPAFFNLGGSWHGVADSLAEVWLALRAAISAWTASTSAPELPLFVEPGRLFARGAGFALGWVRAARALDDRDLRILDLSRICHLRWSQPSLVEPAPRPGHARKLVLAGPTCYEDDLLGEWQVDDANAYAPGAPVILRDLTGYAVAWNSGFAGVPAATVRIVG